MAYNTGNPYTDAFLNAGGDINRLGEFQYNNSGSGMGQLTPQQVVGVQKQGIPVTGNTANTTGRNLMSNYVWDDQTGWSLKGSPTPYNYATDTTQQAADSAAVQQTRTLFNGSNLYNSGGANNTATGAYTPGGNGGMFTPPPAPSPTPTAAPPLTPTQAPNTMSPTSISSAAGGLAPQPGTIHPSTTPGSNVSTAQPAPTSIGSLGQALAPSISTAGAPRYSADPVMAKQQDMKTLSSGGDFGNPYDLLRKQQRYAYTPGGSQFRVNPNQFQRLYP